MASGLVQHNHQINFIVDNPGVDLLVAPLFVGQQQGHRQAGVVRHQPAGGVAVA